MFDNLKADLLRDCYITYQKATLLNKSLVIIKSMGFQTIAIYRFGRWCEQFFSARSAVIPRCFFLAIYRCAYHLLTTMYGIKISPKAMIGKGFYIGHFAGIEIGACTIGEYCSIHQHVKIIAERCDGQRDMPHIGDYVWIGPHAQITTNISIGDRATVSAGTLVVDNVAADHLVVGNPARVISNSYNNLPLLHQLSLGQ